MDGKGSYNQVYRKVGSGKWSTANSTSGGQDIGNATKAAALKSRANRAAKLSDHGKPSGSGGSSGPANNSHRLDRSCLKGKRGWAKKGGGGHGKFTWGMPGDEMMMDKLSKQDPNYDSADENDGNVIFSVLDHHERMAKKAGISLDGFQGGGHLFGSPSKLTAGVDGHPPSALSPRLPPKIPFSEFKKKVVVLVDEFLTSEDVDELTDSLRELRSPMLHYEFVRRAITLAMERNSRERELISVALSELHGGRVLSSEQCGKGFERLFEIVDDIRLDIPSAKKYIAQFLARAVADEILPPSFLSDPLNEQMGGSMVDQAKVLLSIKHGLVRLEHVWGATSRSSIKELKNEIKMLLEEFLNSSDLDEACGCVKNLNVPHFHHEVVKRAVVLSLDCREREQGMMSSLLAELSAREIVSEKQMETGFNRLFSSLTDLELDSPGAARIVGVFLDQAVKDGCLSRQSAIAIRKNAPSLTK
uniref:MI domain-containing protein n=1 Tax=Mucochytrium quahogii TaxID=96639 RepID=A0A7S2R8I9_9STRA|mmetsp:Transcript_6781/g.10742  ORF Transcript_6781/g.10742 Transcript_6781/m.10742 type:complete len:474 (+) Transcript_6781:368-1789(+)